MSSPQEILMVFARYGLQKTSMQDIASAAGVSRQSIYKRYGSKQGAFESVLAAFLEERLSSAAKALKGFSDPFETRILNYFEQWSGQIAPVVGNTEHGAELLDSGIRFAQASERDWEGEAKRTLSDFLDDQNLVRDNEQADEIAHCLSLASKGILLKVQTTEEFSREMKRVIDVVFR